MRLCLLQFISTDLMVNTQYLNKTYTQLYTPATSSSHHRLCLAKHVVSIAYANFYDDDEVAVCLDSAGL